MRWTSLLLIAAAGCGHNLMEPEPAPTPPDSLEGKVKDAVGAKDQDSVSEGRMRVIRRLSDGSETDELVDANPEQLDRLGLLVPRAIADAGVRGAVSIEDRAGEVWTSALEFQTQADAKMVQDAYVQVLNVKTVQTKERILTITGTTRSGEPLEVQHETGLNGRDSRIKISKRLKPGE
jgi:hypothetical protein